MIFFSLFFVVLGFEREVLHLLDRHSYCLSPFYCNVLEIVSYFLSRPAYFMHPATARVVGTHQHAQILVAMGARFLPRLNRSPDFNFSNSMICFKVCSPGRLTRLSTWVLSVNIYHFAYEPSPLVFPLSSHAA
jgi:hypothetical protein